MNQREIENLCRAVMSKEIESVIRILPMKKSSGLEVFTGEFCQVFRELTQILLKLFQKLKRRDHSQTYFMRPTLPWYQSQIRILQENYRLISLMHIDAKTLKKIVANWILQYTEMITFIKFIPRYFIHLVAIENGMVSLISLSASLLLVYRNERFLYIDFVPCNFTVFIYYF